MSNYSVLKQDINNNIYENQTQQITGTVLNAILNEMTASLGAGYQFAGVATVGMNPGAPDQRVFYLAGEGIYTSFGGIQVPAGKLGVLKWDNRWTLQTIDGLGGGGANLTGYVSVASTDDLPDEGVATLGYLCGTNLYLYVGEGGDTKDGKYQDCGSFRGPEGAYIQDIEQTETSTENGGTNTLKMTLSDGRVFYAYTKNGTTTSGLFPTVEALQAAYPSPVVGQYAFVGAGFPADIYVCTTAGTWTDSGEDYDGDNVDLTDYATKAEVNQLEAKVDGVVEEINGINESFGSSILIDGAYISSSNGAEVSSSARSHTDYIHVSPGARLNFAILGTSGAGYAFYDSDKVFVSGFEYSSGQYEEVDTIVPEGVAFIRTTFVPSSYQAYSSFFFRQTKAGMKSDLDYVDDIKVGTALITKTNNNFQLSYNQYYRGDGANISGPISMNGTYCTRIQVKVGDVFYVTGVGPSTTIPLLITTDDNGVIKRTVLGSYRLSKYTITIGQGETYLAVNFYNYDPTKDKVWQEFNYNTNYLYDKINELSEDIGDSEGRNWFWKDKKIVVFGDSITEFKSVLSDNKGWTDKFAELSGANLINVAVGGSRISARRASVLPVSQEETSLENSYRAYNALDVVNLVHEWANADYSVVDTNVAWLASNVSDDNSAQIQRLKDNPIGGVDIVLISAGTNDWHNGSQDGDNTLSNFNVQQVYGALNCIVRDILSANPKIQVFFLSPIPRYTDRNVPAFSTSESYSVGDLVKYSGTTYVFIQSHNPGAWDSSQVRTATDLDMRVDECSSDNVVVDGRTLKVFSEQMEEHIHDFHLPFVNMYENVGMCKYNWSNFFPDNDNTHPHKGYIYLGTRIYQMLSGF